MTVLRALLAPERRGVMSNPWGDWAGDNYGETWSGARVTSETSMQLLTVYGCVRLISDSIATLPIDVIDSTAPPWIQQPKPGIDRVAWMTQVLVSLLLDGNAYIAVLYDTVGRIVSLEPLDPNAVTAKRDGARIVYEINGAPTNLQILHIPGLMKPGAIVGLSPVEAARQSIGIGMATQEFAGRFFTQGAVMSGVIEVPGALDPDMTKRMAKHFRRLHTGKNVHLPGVLEGGATWKTTGVTNEQAQFLQTRRFTAAEIAGQMFLLDPSDLGIPVEGTSLTYANLEQRNARRVQVTFLPWIIRIENALTSLLGAGYVKFNVNGLLRGDTKTRFETYKIARDIDAMTLDEIRDLEDLEPLPDRAPAPPSLTDQIEAVGQLIRAGFDPQASLSFLGLPPIQHTGLVPITVAPEKTPGGGTNA